MQRNRERLTSWLSGPILHNHFRLEGESPIEKERHQFDLNAALAYLREFSQSLDVLISDNNHSLLPTWESNFHFQREMDEPLEKWNEWLVKFCDKSLLDRVSKIESPSILTGVETDIISELGELTTSDDILEKLDVVVASLHWLTWKEFQEIGTVDPILEKGKILSAFLAVILNQHVDILGHPNFLPHGRISKLFEPDDFIPVLEGLAKSGQAWEINLSRSYLDSPFDQEIFKIIAKMGVNVSLALDFHHPQYYWFPEYYDEDVNLNNWEIAFRENQKKFHFLFLLHISRNLRLLEQLGIKPEQVINSSNENFERWQLSR